MSNTPEQLFEQGFTDLISVIPPGAQLAPSSAIPQAQVGKVPGRRTANGLWVGYDWRKHNAALDDVRKWMLDGANIGLRADRFPGVDIDVTDPTLAKIIEDAAIGKLGAAPVRIGKAPKRLLMYRTDEPFGRMRLWFEKNSQHFLVEILGVGQQYLVHGIHPGTLKPYEWTTAPQKTTALTVITKQQADDFLTYLGESLSVLGVMNIEREGDGSTSARLAVDQLGLRAPTIALLREAVTAIPNTNELFPDRTSYLKMGYAIKAAGSESPDEAHSIFTEWAARWPGNDRVSGNDPDTVLADWRRIRPPFSVGWSWIAEQARAFGFDTSGVDFDVVEDRPSERPRSAPLYSEQWLADRVVERQRGNLRYVPQKAHYLAWHNGTWRPDAELLAEDIIKKELRTVANEIQAHGVTPKEHKESEKLAVSICTAGKVSAVASLVRSDRGVAVGVESLDHDPWVLNTPAGLVDLTTGELGPANPDSLCTKTTAVPPDFSGAHPAWDRFLTEATGGDVELIDFLQRLSGYVLTGSTREQQLTFIFGPGGNGKSVFLNVLTGILGDYARVASMDTFTASFNEKHTTDVAMLTGARLVTASETQAGKRWDEPRLKSLTGGEPVTARYMRQDNFTYLPQFKLVFVGNHKPEIRDVDAAMKRRIQMVPFVVTPAVVDKELAAKLRQEWPAILAWMIQGCLDWQENGLTPPPSVRASTDEYFDDEDAIGRWLRDSAVLVEGGFETSQALFLSWREWANRNGEHVGSLKRLSKSLETRKLARGVEPKSRKLGFAGIQLKPQDSLEEML